MAERVNAMLPAKRGISMVFQSYALYPHMSVFENMAFGLEQAKLDRAEMANAAYAKRRRCCKYRISRPQAETALRRTAPARGHRTRHHAQPARLPVRRAAVQSRCRPARRNPHRARAPAQAARRNDHDLCHPRPGGGDDARRPHRRPQQGLRRAGGRADGAVQQAGNALRRRVHRIAAHEHHRGRCR
jgi:ABC-type sugar transport system ATPase subunit